MKYRKMPVVIDAVRWTGDNLEQVIEFLGDDYGGLSIERNHDGEFAVYVNSMEGFVRGEKGCMIMRGVNGEHYVCDYDIFLKTYEEVESEAEVAEQCKRVCVPEGYKVVPVEPTPEMLEAAIQDGVCVDGKPVWKKDLVFQAKWKYQQMLEAAPVAAQGVAELPFVRKILEKLERFRACAEDDEDVDIGRHWLDILTRLGLLNRVQHSPERWEMTAQADDALEAAHHNKKVTQ